MTVSVTWESTPNFGCMDRGTFGRAGHRIIGIVNHRTADEDPAATINWFKSAASQVSAHYLIDKAGKVYQFLHANDTAWHAGLLVKPDLSIPWLAEAIRTGVNPNLLLIGIEHTGQSYDVMAEAQYQASLRLQRYLIGGYAITPDAQHILAHSRINAGHNCPGPAFPWSRLLADLVR